MGLELKIQTTFRCDRSICRSQCEGFIYLAPDLLSRKQFTLTTHTAPIGWLVAEHITLCPIHAVQGQPL